MRRKNTILGDKQEHYRKIMKEFLYFWDDFLDRIPVTLEYYKQGQLDKTRDQIKSSISMGNVALCSMCLK